MNPDLTHIVVVLDKSGSMAGTVDETIKGFNAFIGEQREQPGKARLTMALFNDQYTLLHDDVPLANVPDLSRKTYVPVGGTALYDAVGQATSTVRARIAALPPEHVPGKVVFLIITDGAENLSQEIRTRAQVAELIQTAKDTDKWQFVFIGANIDAAEVATSVAVDAGNALQYGQQAGGTLGMYDSVTRSMTNYRQQNEAVVDCFFDPQTVDIIVKP